MNDLKLIDAADYKTNIKPVQRQRLPWYLKTQGSIEKWVLRNVKGINPDNQRVVRFFTYNDEDGIDFDYKCPHYTYDYNSCLYDDFLEVCEEIGQTLHDIYGVPGNYYYDVKVTLDYVQDADDYDGDWKRTHCYVILKTDNPRCVEGRTRDRKDCSHLTDYNSHITISGYSLSGKYRRMVDILEDLSTKIVVVHSHQDARAFLRIMKFLGINHIRMGKHYRYNMPAKYGKLTKSFFGYYLEREDNETIVCRMHRSYCPAVAEVIDIDEFIVKRTWKARMKDRWER